MSNSALCAALNSLIEDCTVILGWCFTSEEVAETKQKQKEVTWLRLEECYIYVKRLRSKDLDYLAVEIQLKGNDNYNITTSYRNCFKEHMVNTYLAY